MGLGTLFNYFKVLKRISPYTLDLITANTDKEFDMALDNWLLHGIEHLEKNKKNYQKLDEEGLSAVLATALTTGEVFATQEENSNGHVDLTIRLINVSPQRKRLGEAKMWRNNSYQVSGITQLLTRYTTGRECRGFVISYVKEKDIKDLFKELRKYIDNTKSCDLDGLCKDHNIRWSFLSNHKHSSGELIEICNLSCNLFI